MNETEKINRGWSWAGPRYHRVTWDTFRRPIARCSPAIRIINAQYDRAGFLEMPAVPSDCTPCKRCFPKGDTP